MDSGDAALPVVPDAADVLAMDGALDADELAEDAEVSKSFAWKT